MGSWFALQAVRRSRLLVPPDSEIRTVRISAVLNNPWRVGIPRSKGRSGVSSPAPISNRRSPVAKSLVVLALALPLLGLSARAEVPYPSCASQDCADPKDYASYLFLRPGMTPPDFDAEHPDAWKYLQGSGLNVVNAWQISTGRPDVVIAVLDSGVDWSRADLVRKIRLNTGELPLPENCSPDYDCNGDGVVNIEDFPATPDWNGNGLADPQDLIRAFSDGVDDDGNGFRDDIAGWDFLEGNNDAEDNTAFYHGTNQGLYAAAEAGNQEGIPGIAPSVMLLPLRVSDSFVSREPPFARAVRYAVEVGVSAISEALGTLSSSPRGQEAIDYAYVRGVPIIASAADEQSFHHNFPSGFRHTIWVNSIRNGDGTVVLDTDQYDLLNGCTNFGGQAWVSVSSTGCSSEATARAAGLVGLLLSQAANLVDRGEMALNPRVQRPLSAEEVRQLLRLAAEDIDHGEDLALTTDPLFDLLGVFFIGPFFESKRFPTTPGWDEYTGYGRPDAVKLLQFLPEVPPEVDLQGLDWFEIVPPVGQVPLRAHLWSRRPDDLTFHLEIGCGVQPDRYFELATGSLPPSFESSELALWDAAESAALCGFDPSAPTTLPDDHSVTLRLRAMSPGGLEGEDRRVLAIHEDPSWSFPAIRLSGSAESGALLADIDRDSILDVVAATSAGEIHVLHGWNGKELLGFPIRTPPLLQETSSPATLIRDEIVAPAAGGDLNGDHNIEIVVASLSGKVYVFDDLGRPVTGFPVATQSRFSAPANRDAFNDPQPGILGAPTLSDLDGDGRLDILVSALDGQLYAWDYSGRKLAGFPISLVDPDQLSVESDGRVFPLKQGALGQLRKSVTSPAVGDLDGDGNPEIIVGTSERYQSDTISFSTDGSFLIGVLQDLADGMDSPAEISFRLTGRLYSISTNRLGSKSPLTPGWPAKVPVLLPGGLPIVATGIVGSAALAPDEMGGLQVGTFSAVGPALLLNAQGESRLGADRQNRPRPLAFDFAGTGFPFVPSSAGSSDAPFFASLGSGIFVDLNQDGIAEFVAPTSGVRQLLDIAAPGSQEFSDHQLSAWDTRSGQLLSGFPVIIEDLQFLQGPSAADVDGDGFPEILVGSGGYQLHAIRRDGSEAPGWPKFTNGWIVASPVAGDVDGDGLLEVVATTREGYLFVWDTPSAATPDSVPWQGFGHDALRTQNSESPTSPLAPLRSPLDSLLWQLEAFWQRFPVF